MSEVERKYIKSIDELILKASGNTLKKLQELDLKCQLQAKTFYDTYLANKENLKKEKAASTTHH